MENTQKTSRFGGAILVLSAILLLSALCASAQAQPIDVTMVAGARDLNDIAPGATITFLIRVNPNGHTISRIEWFVFPGGGESLSGTEHMRHTFPTPGDYVVQANVYDDTGTKMVKGFAESRVHVVKSAGPLTKPAPKTAPKVPITNLTIVGPEFAPVGKPVTFEYSCEGGNGSIHPTWSAKGRTIARSALRATFHTQETVPIHLEVTDDIGQTAHTDKVIIAYTPLAYRIHGPTKPQVGSTPTYSVETTGGYKKVTVRWSKAGGARFHEGHTWKHHFTTEGPIDMVVRIYDEGENKNTPIEIPFRITVGSASAPVASGWPPFGDNYVAKVTGAVEMLNMPTPPSPAVQEKNRYRAEFFDNGNGEFGIVIHPDTGGPTHAYGYLATGKLREWYSDDRWRGTGEFAGAGTGLTGRLVDTGTGKSVTVVLMPRH